MVIICSKSGRLANRIWAFSHFIGNAIEYKYSLLNPSFDEYCGLFPATRGEVIATCRIRTTIGMGISYSRFEMLARLTEKYLPRSPWHQFVRLENVDDEFDISSRDFVRMARSKIILTHGWKFCDRRSLLKHGNLIRDVFTPDASTLERVQDMIAICRGKGDVLVGVHVRRGDYKKWSGGMYYFSDQEYVDKMRQVCKCIDVGSDRVSFLVCSDEKLDKSNFADFSVTFGSGVLLEDLYSLASCDYLIGPPSTYSMWASFYGEVPLHLILSSVQQIASDGFRVSSGPGSIH